MKALYLLPILVGLIVVYRVIVITKKSKKKSSKSNPKHPVFKDILKLQEMMCTGEIVNGRAAGGYGEFGYSPTNPIPVKGVFGETNYLERLRSEDGVKVEYNRLGHVRSDNIENPVDMYEIRLNGEFKCKLYLCPYYDGMSDSAPNGFVLIK